MPANLDLSTIEPKLFKARVYLICLWLRSKNLHLLFEKVHRLRQVVGLITKLKTHGLSDARMHFGALLLYFFVANPRAHCFLVCSVLRTGLITFLCTVGHIHTHAALLCLLAVFCLCCF